LLPFQRLSRFLSLARVRPLTVCVPSGISTSSGVMVQASIGILVRIVVGVGNRHGEVPPGIKVSLSVRILYQIDGCPTSVRAASPSRGMRLGSLNCPNCRG